MRTNLAAYSSIGHAHLLHHYEKEKGEGRGCEDQERQSFL